jgi:arginine-tRNA-protein transferase
MMHESGQYPIAFYVSVPVTCSYLPDQVAVTVFADPSAPMNKTLYSALVDRGFRRSGNHVYMPYCPNCDHCIPARIPVARFRPNRSQRRTMQRNADLRVRRVETVFDEKHFDLYRRYMTRRHAGSGMDDYSPEQYISFLACSWGETCLYEFLLYDAVVAVASVDHLDNGLSAVYTFYDPDLTDRSLGTFAVLWQVEETARLGLPYVYLGYWIKQCGKMRYKATFQPLEIHRNGRWRRSESPD